MIWVKPPVSAGFSDEVVGLIEDVDMMLGLDATVASAGGGKSESRISCFCWRTQSVTVNSAVKNNVPSGSLSDVLPFTSTQSEREDWTYSQRIHIDDETRC